MVSFEIVYLRDDDKLDCIIKDLLDSTKLDFNLSIHPLSFLDNKNLRDIKFDILIILGNFPLREALSSDFSPWTRSIIEIKSEDNQDLYSGVEIYKSYIYEQFPEQWLFKAKGHFSHVIRKNALMLKKLETGREILKNVLEISNDGVSIIDAEGKFIETNGRITEGSTEELRGQQVLDFLPEKSKKELLSFLEKTSDNGYDDSIELEVITRSGLVKPVNLKLRPIKILSGESKGFLAITSDITEKKEAWKKEQFIRHLFEASKDGIGAIDESGKITVWNRGAEEIFGYTQEEAFNLDMEDFAGTLDDHFRFMDSVKRIREDGFLKNVMLNARRKDGRKLAVELTMSSIKDEDGNFSGISINARDVSSTQEYLEEIKKKNDEMEHMINVVSHDLRSPLHSIDNYLSFIQDIIKESITNDDVFEMMERIHANLTNIEALIQDLTDFSRAGSRPEDEVNVDLNSLIDDIMSNLLWQVGRDKVSVTIKDLPAIRINPGRIHHVFENLINNAYKFRKEDEKADIELDSEVDGEFVIFKIIDKGIGISQKHQDKIFNLFYRTKEKVVEGTGAGLAITKKIINNYGGEIWVESESGSGSTFKFTLPKKILTVL